MVEGHFFIASQNRQRGVYTYREAAALMNVSSSKVKRWADGYTFKNIAGLSTQKPVLQTDRASGVLSFLELVELFFVKEYRTLDVPLPVIRSTAEMLRADFGEYPFSKNQVMVAGRELLIPTIDGLMRPDIGQIVGEFAENILVQLEFDQSSDNAYIYRPRNFPGVVLNAEVRYGAPTVSEFSVPTKTLYRLWLKEKSIGRVASYHEVAESEVVAAINFESDVRFSA